jgi:hypothetical protein
VERRLTALLVLALIPAGCGGSSKPATPGPGTVVFQGSEWAVVLDHGKATAQHLVGGDWVSDRTGVVEISILGPDPGSKGNPGMLQVAAELGAPKALVESALWVDGTELLEKGGGLRPNRGTIYGTPAEALKPGKHTAVAYGRTATHATAVAWTFSVG